MVWELAMAGTRGIQSIEVGGRLLSSLVANATPMMLRDLALATGLAPAQVHAYLTSYRRIGLVEQDERNGLYRLGPFAMRLGLGRLRCMPLINQTSRILDNLADEYNLMALLVVWGPQGPTVVQVVEESSLSLNIRRGTVFELTSTASGHIFTALSNLSQVAQMAEDELNGITKKAQRRLARGTFEAAIEAVRRRGYAVIKDTPILGVSAISAPIFSPARELVAAITLVGPSSRLSVDEDSAVIRRLLDDIHALDHGDLA